MTGYPSIGLIGFSLVASVCMVFVCDNAALMDSNGGCRSSLGARPAGENGIAIIIEGGKLDLCLLAKNRGTF